MHDVDIKFKTYDNLIDVLNESLDLKNSTIEKLQRQLSTNFKDTIAVPV